MPFPVNYTPVIPEKLSLMQEHVTTVGKCKPKLECESAHDKDNLFIKGPLEGSNFPIIITKLNERTGIYEK